MFSPLIYWRNKKEIRKFLGKKGRLLSFTKIINPLSGFGKRPYYVGLAFFPKLGKKTAALIINDKKPQIGSKVVAVLRLIGEQEKEEFLNYGLKFKVL